MNPGNEFPTEAIRKYLEWIFGHLNGENSNIIHNEWITANTLTQIAALVGKPCGSAEIFHQSEACVFLYQMSDGQVIFGQQLCAPKNYADPIPYLKRHAYWVFGPFEARETAITVLKSLWPNAVKII